MRINLINSWPHSKLQKSPSLQGTKHQRSLQYASCILLSPDLRQKRLFTLHDCDAEVVSFSSCADLSSWCWWTSNG